jgi:hypothetical protein
MLEEIVENLENGWMEIVDALIWLKLTNVRVKLISSFCSLLVFHCWEFMYQLLYRHYDAADSLTDLI